jgi:hypothetical protein
VTPYVSVPIGVEDGDTSFGFAVSFSFARR